MTMKSFGLLLLLSSTFQVAAKLGESHLQPEADRRELVAVQFHGSNPSQKLGRCEGDCDRDSDCNSSDLACAQRNAFDPVPGCSGGTADASNADYCVRKSDLNGDGNNNNNNNIDASAGQTSLSATTPIAWSTNFPLATCQGDCDSDFDCQGGLICFQRNSKQSVPGCLGGEHDWSMTDYCIPRLGSSNSNAPNNDGKLPVSWSTNFPLGRCQGDCDSDADCQGYLKCYQRNGGKSVPGCTDGGSDSSNVDYCFDDGTRNQPTPSPPSPPPPANNGNTAQYIGDGDYSNNPLGACQGDCDSNADCKNGLFCWQRNEGESMPYCSGAQGGIDYCLPNSESPGTKLKMYWDNYFWQETYDEAFWCMTCTKCATPTTGDGWEGDCKDPPDGRCHEGHFIWIQRCRDVRKRFDIIKNPNSGDQIKVHGTNLCFRNSENKFLELRPCDKNNDDQLWASMNNRNKFEIRPWKHRNRSTKDALCVSQLHHPKATEVLSLRECWLNIHYETNYWMEYY